MFECHAHDFSFRDITRLADVNASTLSRFIHGSDRCRIELKGISLGGSGVLFVALISGHYQCKIPGVIGTLGLVLFVYGVGVGAGPRFFRAFVTQGKALAKMGILLVGARAATCEPTSSRSKRPLRFRW